jgi:S1-C subfamily serine protease
MMVNFYILSPDNSGPSVAVAPSGGPAYVYVPDTQSDDGPPSPPPGGSHARNSEVLGKIDLEGLPPTIHRAMKANVLIMGSRSLGSGVVIQRMGGEVLILTNHHVVTESTNLNEKVDLKKVARPNISYFNEQINKGTVIWIAPDGIDLALVKAPAPTQIEPVVWKGVAKVLPSEEVFAVGNPLGLSWSFTKGFASAIRQEKKGEHEVGMIQSDLNTTFGNSGGGLYNTKGELIGINSSIVAHNLGKIGFAIRPQILIELKPEGLNVEIPGSNVETPEK